MITFFRKLPITVKLLIVGLLPIVLLIYFASIIYAEKNEKLKMLGEYIDRIELSEVVENLIISLGKEQQFSYHSVLPNENPQRISEQRKITDSLINTLNGHNDFNYKHFSKFTFLDELPKIRSLSDQDRLVNAKRIIDFYSFVIFRLNSLNLLSPLGFKDLNLINQDLIAHRIIAQMLSTLEVIRTNIYNYLDDDDKVENSILTPTTVYKNLKSYGTEFILKSTPSNQKSFDSLVQSKDVRPMMAYLDTLFTTQTQDSIYTAQQWWNISTLGTSAIEKQKEALWKSVCHRLHTFYTHEKESQNITFIILALTILLVSGFIIYAINHITHLLKELEIATGKISRGATGIIVKTIPRGILGRLAKSILEIDSNNLALAKAANEIGKGNFKVVVIPRGDEDILGLSIKKMKQDLREFNSQKDRIQNDTLNLIKQRDEFLSMTSHELKTPVTSLKVYTELLLMDVNGDNMEQRKEMLEKMYKQIKKLVTLINDLLDTSQLQYGQLAYYKEPVKLNKLVSEIISQIHTSHPTFKIIFQKNINVMVNADRDRISQVLSNLITNAIKYAPDSKEIIVRLEKNEQSVICLVKDFGPGIRDTEKEKIFDRFYRISGENLHTYPGLGLGLYISKQIVEKHEGKLWYKSEYGSGSTFYFELPVMRE